MVLFTLGINHHTAPLALRERVAWHAEILPRALNQLIAMPGVYEAAILSTCNRTEIYGLADDPAGLVDWLAEQHHVPKEQLQAALYSLTQDAALRHLFRVAAGLESMVIGEPQILGQLKAAVRLAEAAGSLGRELHQVFQRTFALAKAVRANTTIGQNTVSLAAASVRLAERIFERIEEQHVLFVGAGEMIALCATHFAARRPQTLAISNRTPSRAQALAEKIGGVVIPLDALHEHIAQFDIVITCTASPLPIIGLGMVARAIKWRRHRPIFMVDLAVPRDIEAEVAELDDVFLYTLDDLGKLVATGHERRQTAIAEAEAIIDAHLEQWARWQKIRGNVPQIRALREAAERIRCQVLEQAHKQLQRGEDPERIIEQLAWRLTQKLLHAPTRALHHPEEKAVDAMPSIDAGHPPGWSL